MTQRVLRAVVVAALPFGLFVNQPGAQECKGDPLEGIVVKDSPNGDTFYQPRPIVWPVPDIFLSAFMVRSGSGTRTLVLGVVLNGVHDDVLGPLALSIDGSAVSLKLKDHPRIDTSGCVPTATQTIRDDDNLVRKISLAADVQVAYEAPKVRLKAALTREDLERFQRIIALHDMEVLPPAPPPSKDPSQDWRRFATPTEDVSNPTIIISSKVEPRYPPEAIAKGKSGQVVLAARILKDGTVGTMRPVSISAGGCGLAEAAMEAVKQWRYTPAMKNGQPVEADFTIVVDFALENPSGRVALFETPVAGFGARAL